MAETSGFFQAMWDDSLKNPTTEEYTGWWDRDYTANQFMKYFSLFVGNGVFVSPTNQLKVIPGTGLSVIITEGWGFINGAWYHNDSNLEVPLVTNGTSNNRVDSIRLRYSESSRSISSAVFTGDTNLVRGETIYDLELAEVIVTPGSVTISASNITDIRTNENRCGFVKGLLEVISTEDLFSQFESLFNDWFLTVKGQVTGDLAIRLQAEFEELNQNVVLYQQNVETQIETYKTETDAKIEEYNTNYQQTLNESKSLIENYVYNDYVIPEQELTFIDNVCTVEDSKVTANSLIDVYFTADTIQEAEDCKIYVDSSDGLITLTAETQPTTTIKALMRVRVL
ncbi:MAG: hypothetical protein J6D28_02735 [Bacilli bacterium]|nr:hypothetical protein [Bacilli bacterium]